jgi:hypothetical protein
MLSGLAGDKIKIGLPMNREANPDLFQIFRYEALAFKTYFFTPFSQC